MTLSSLNRVLAVASSLCFGLSSTGLTKTLDRTQATVNGDAILESEFQKAVGPALEAFKKSAPTVEQTPERVSEIKKRILDQMIDDRVLKQEAKKRGVKVSQPEMDEGIKKVRSRFPTEEEFNKELAKEAVNFDQFKKNIGEQLGTIKMIDQEVRGKVVQPTDDDAKRLFDALDALLNNKAIPSGYTPAELDQLKPLARDLGARFSESVHARHILIRIPPNATQAQKDEAMKKIKDIRKKVVKGGDFTQLAKEFSEDPGSKERGGDLGNFSRGMMVPAFEKTAFSLGVGQVSEVVTTDFGYHVIKVEEKKAASKPAFEPVKDALKEFIYQQRAAKRFEEFVKDVRSKANIKINEIK